MRNSRIAVTVLLLLSAATLSAAESVDLQTVTRIRQEGFRNSSVMEYASTLTDVYGGRVTGSKAIKDASEWARTTLASMGLANARLEPWSPYGRGWNWESATFRMTAPTNAQFVAIPEAWSPGTNGPVRAEVVVAKLATKADLETWKGKLKGKIVLNGSLTEVKFPEGWGPARYDDEALEKAGQYRIPGRRTWGPSREEWLQRRDMRRAVAEFLTAEGILAVVKPGEEGEGNTFDVAGASTNRKSDPIGVPSIVIPAEQFNRIVRISEKKIPVEAELDVRAAIDDAQETAWNAIAEIPGTDKKNEVVIIGAHIDSWHGGTGATDNASGVAIMMEAMRIIKALGDKPRRTIRIALWSGEEQGLLGSRAYVSQNYGERAEPKDPDERDLPLSLRKEKTALTVKPDHAKVAAYFNIDNGSGKLRGIYAQENAALVPIFTAWLEPLHDIGATTVTMNNTTGTDHLSFDTVGLPGFQFIQDGVDYNRTHHSTFDVYERLQKDDLMQASVVVAHFSWMAANRPEMLPRKPLPQ
ncbi:MAG: M20/M25/M40 family metallo-hydrolase [Thermoanaerobaculia bacterium]